MISVKYFSNDNDGIRYKIDQPKDDKSNNTETEEFNNERIILALDLSRK